VKVQQADKLDAKRHRASSDALVIQQTYAKTMSM